MTATQRASAIHIGIPGLRVYPIPDGTVGAEDRQHVALLYGGILAGAQTAPTVFGDLTTLYCNYAWNTLRDAHPTAVDTNTLLRDDLVNVVAGGNSPDDLNTALAFFLS
jgi:hypothetical protein